MTTANLTVIENVLFKRGNTATLSTYTGVSGEVLIDTTLKTLRIQDGVTAGGTRLATYAELGNVSIGNVDLTGYATVAQINSANAAITSLQSNAAIQAQQIANAGSTFGNANVTTYLTAVSGNIIPAANVTYTLGNEQFQWKELWVSNNTIYIGNTPLRVQNGQLLVNNAPVVDSTVRPYLELTNTPFITQPVTLGNLVTVTAEPWSESARFTVVIGAGPVIDSITITTAGTGYVVGQQYRISNDYIGGSNIDSSIDFEVATVGAAGELLGIADAAFVGNATNTSGTYTNAVPQYLPSVFDDIDTGLVLTRGRIRGIFNIADEAEYDRNNNTSPAGTEWNSEGWGDLSQLGTRTYTTWYDALDGAVGENIVGAELVMHDTVNDKYYKFEFTEWGGSDGGFVYTRALITDPNYFRKTDGLEDGEIDVIVEDDGDGGGIGITRGLQNGIYNPYRDEGWSSSVSPSGTLWNIDGWDDLSDITERTYTNFYAAYGNGQLGNRVPGSKAIMYVEEIDKYYAVDWISWTQGGNYGGFSYTRKEIDLDKIDEGIRFADGTVQTTAYIPVDTNVISTAPNDRRIETASGYKQVAVTAETRGETLNATIRNTSNNWDFYVDATETLNLLYDQDERTYSYLEFSFDDEATWVKVDFGGGSFEQYYQMVFDDGIYRSVTEDDTVRYRVVSGGGSVVWWDKDELPGGSNDFRGAIIDYHAYTSHGTIIGTIHIIDDDGDEYITHTEVSSADSNDSMYDNLWIVTSEGEIRYARVDGSAKTLKIHWTAKVFYGSDYSDD